MLLNTYLFAHPAGSFYVTDSGDRLRLLVFAATGILLAFIVEACNRAVKAYTERREREADTLQDNLSWIKYEAARMTDDGKLSPGEAKRLDALLDRNHNMIFNKKHNPVTVFYTKKIGIGQFIADRIRNQQARINQGIGSRSLTRREADILIDNLNRIRDDFERFKRDGRLTYREADRLDRILDRNSEMIFAKNHNRNAPIESINFQLFIDRD